MVLTDIIETEHGAAMGLKIAIGDPSTPLLIIRAEKGYLATDYMDRRKIEAEGDVACIVPGKTFQDMLDRRVAWVSTAARKLGVKSVMKGADALDLMI